MFYECCPIQIWNITERETRCETIFTVPVTWDVDCQRNEYCKNLNTIDAYCRFILIYRSIEI